MRLPLIAAVLAAAAPLPALAQDAGPSPLKDAAEAMADPATQQQAGMMAAMLVGALLEMPVGPLAEAVAEMGGNDAPDIDPDARVRDLLGPQADGASEQVAERVPQMMAAMSGMTVVLEEMLPVLQGMAERLPRTLPNGEQTGPNGE